MPVSASTEGIIKAIIVNRTVFFITLPPSMIIYPPIYIFYSTHFIFGLYLFISSELDKTLTELKAIAAPAIIGLSNQPVKG